MYRGTLPCAAGNRARQLAEQIVKPRILSPGLDLKIVGFANSVELLFLHHILSVALVPSLYQMFNFLTIIPLYLIDLLC